MSFGFFTTTTTKAAINVCKKVSTEYAQIRKGAENNAAENDKPNSVFKDATDAVVSVIKDEYRYAKKAVKNAINKAENCTTKIENNYSDEVLKAAEDNGISPEQIDNIKKILSKALKNEINDDELIKRLGYINFATTKGCWSSIEKLIEACENAGVKLTALDKFGDYGYNGEIDTLKPAVEKYIKVIYNYGNNSEKRNNYYNSKFSTKDSREKYVGYLKDALYNNKLSDEEIAKKLGCDSIDDFIKNGINEDNFKNGTYLPECFKDDVKNYIKTDLSKNLFIFSDDEASILEETYFKNGETYLEDVFNDIYSASSSKVQQSVANNIKYDDEHKQYSTQNMFGEEKDATKTSAAFARKRSQQYQENFVADLNEDIKNNPTDKITQNIAAANMVGLQENENIDKSKKTELATLVYNTTEEVGINREVLTIAANYMQQNPEILENVSVEEFTATMNEVSNGNYSIVVNDIKNGTTTELNSPIQATNTSNNGVAQADSNSPSEAVVQSCSAPVNTTNVTNNTTENTSVEIAPAVIAQSANSQAGSTKSNGIKEEKQTQESTPTPAKSIEMAIKSGVEAVKEYTNNNALAAAILILNSKTNSTSVINFAINTFKSMSHAVQKLTFERIHDSSASRMIINKAMDKSLLCEIEGKNIWEKEMIDQRKEELKKQNPDAFNSIFNNENA